MQQFQGLVHRDMPQPLKCSSQARELARSPADHKVSDTKTSIGELLKKIEDIYWILGTKSKTSN